MHMPSFQMHCNCKVASPTCFCIANQFHKLCTERNTSTCNLICGPIVFSKPVFSPGSRPSPLYCLTHPNKNDLVVMCLFYQYELVYQNPKLGTFELWTKLEKVETGRTRLMAMDSLEYINSVSTLMDYFTFLDGSFFRQRVLCSKSLWSLSYTVD